MHERDCDKIVEELEKVRKHFYCKVCGSSLTESQYRELIEETHLLLAEFNLHATMNQIPIEVPDGFKFAD